MCEKGKKPDFVKSVFDICSCTQTVIFCNDGYSAERLHEMMLEASYKSVIILARMSIEERDHLISNFR